MIYGMNLVAGAVRCYNIIMRLLNQENDGCKNILIMLELRYNRNAGEKRNNGRKTKEASVVLLHRLILSNSIFCRGSCSLDNLEKCNYASQRCIQNK